MIPPKTQSTIASAPKQVEGVNAPLAIGLGAQPMDF
jgi:hypothetical protein